MIRSLTSILLIVSTSGSLKRLNFLPEEERDLSPSPLGDFARSFGDCFRSLGDLTRGDLGVSVFNVSSETGGVCGLSVSRGSKPSGLSAGSWNGTKNI